MRAASSISALAARNVADISRNTSGAQRKASTRIIPGRLLMLNGEPIVPVSWR